MSGPLHQLGPVAAVLLDLDGVLVDSSPAVNRHWLAFADRCQVDGEAVLEVAHGRPSRDVIARFVPDPAVAANHLDWFERLETEDTADVLALPGAQDLMAQLAGGRWAVVTSGGNAVAAARLQAAGLPVPDVLITAEDVVWGKPDPEGYRRATKLLGAEGLVVVFEDSPPGVAAGRAAGSTVVGVATTYPRAVLDTELVVRSLADVTARTAGPLELELDLRGLAG